MGIISFLSERNSFRYNTSRFVSVPPFTAKQNLEREGLLLCKSQAWRSEQHGGEAAWE